MIHDISQANEELIWTTLKSSLERRYFLTNNSDAIDLACKSILNYRYTDNSTWRNIEDNLLNLSRIDWDLVDSSQNALLQQALAIVASYCIHQVENNLSGFAGYDKKYWISLRD